MEVLDYLSNINNLKSWYQEAADNSDRLLVVGLNGSLKIMALERLIKETKRTLCVVVSNELQARKLVDEWKTISKYSINLYPVNDILSAEFSISSKENLIDRINALNFLMSKELGAIVVTTNSLNHQISDPKLWKDSYINLVAGDNYNFEDLKNKLVLMGYNRSPQVEKPGDYSVRGSLIDIYPLTLDNPIRIDFFDDEIDSIRYFDFITQKSIENIEQITILPATDLIITKENYSLGCEQLNKEIIKTKDSKKEHLIQTLERLYDSWGQNISTELDRLYGEILFEYKYTILDYLRDDIYYIVDDYNKILEVDRQLQQDEQQLIDDKIKNGFLYKKINLIKPISESVSQISNISFLSVLNQSLSKINIEKTFNINYQAMTEFFSQLPLLKMECERFIKQKYTVFICASDDSKVSKINQILEDLEIPVCLSNKENMVQNKIQIINFPIFSGFELTDDKIAVITEKEIFNKIRVKKRKNNSQLTNAERLRSYNELNVGDYVVHVNHGIGKYLGMETIEVDGKHQDYITIMYQNDDKIFIPVNQLDLVQKYVAKDGYVPKINKLGGKEWNKTKDKAIDKINDIADELIDLYSKREELKGFAFSKDNDQQRAFENEFPYIETDDQLRSTKEIKEDMEKSKPMDRLLVGDVGYGKTEVALRSACKAVLDHKQVAFLVPTTILAQQHYETIKRRFKNFDIKVGLLNRFKTPKEQKELISDLQQGKIDIVVGTHRILSKDIEFYDLGLLIIDEEQRFGVKHKERLKQLKNQVDVLTLTATPIPRTLHMSMVGVRDLSVIETPPANRFPVQTYVLEQNYDVIKEAIEREVSRNGQVFYLFNNVEKMEQKANELQMLLPNIKIGYAHGQMAEHELEDILMDFLEGRYDVLVTTTIVETGVDMPNVNTIIIENADRMGLSQLYQLRGRVGRSERIAYAYFMYQPNRILSEVSEQRLEAIKEFTDLGSGFKIAMRDLSIRGAGNLLGSKQHGFIDSIGFDLYSQLLENAINERRDQNQEKLQAKEVVQTHINLNIDAYIPKTYIEDDKLKIEIYKRLKEAKNLNDIDLIEEELLDRFGDYPIAVIYLLNLTRLKIIAMQSGILEIKNLGNQVIVKITKEASQIYQPQNYMNALQKTKMKVRFKPTDDQMELHFNIQGLKTEILMNELEVFIKELHNEYQISIEEE